MYDLEKRIIELENKVKMLEQENQNFKKETVEAIASKFIELNAMFQQFQENAIDSCTKNFLQLLEQKKIIQDMQ